MRTSSVIARIGLVLVAGALLAALTGCVGEGDRPGAGPSPTASSPDPTSTGAATPVGRSPATPPPPRQADAPASVELPGADITAGVVAVGAAPDGQMDLPADPNVVGWYRHGPAAGDGAGSVVLAGHVDSLRYGVGPLARLPGAEVGDAVLVRTTAGEPYRYRVTAVRHVPRAELPAAEVFSRAGDERLRIITCAGEFVPGQGYENNVIVTAEPE
ncbi:MAG: sortase domain-bontaining protein [Actinomycetota bacterium]